MEKTMMPFAAVAQLAEELAATSSRLQKRAAIADAIARVHRESVDEEDAGRFALYLAGTPFAEADPRKLNAGGALLSKALLEVSGATGVELTAAYKRHGDLGAAGFDLLVGKAQAAGGLSLVEVADAFAAMASARTTAVRAGLVEGLLRRASALEAKYLLKLMIGDMRIGVKQSLVEEAIAAAASVPVAEVRHAVMLEADLSLAVRRAFAGTLREARMRLFHPLGFMLASPVASPEEAVERFASVPEDEVEAVQIAAFLEDKYDGMRAQVHCGDPEQPGRVTIYSRNREEVTESYPELEEAFAKVTEVGEGLLGGSGLILDGEILGWDIRESRALPFAVLGQRIGRKRVSNAWREQVPVVFMAFDLLYAEGALLLGRPLEERRNRLEGVVERLVEVARSPLAVDERAKLPQGLMFAEPEGELVERLLLAPSRLVESVEDIERAYAEARARANEGVMLKAADSVYQPGRRGLAWLKMKRELATLDVVVTGAEFGHGKRAGILSDYTFAVRGPEYEKTGELLNVGKAYSGLTDAEIAEMSAWMMEHTLEDRGFFRTVEPLRVLEVAFNNIMRSDRHASGFALRFPRIVRIRDDKPVEEIDTVERVEEVYESQVDKPQSHADTAVEASE
ncbi:MAG TPA: ATP-dependent DNA ligase [Edaphobacter sp.]